jgi:VWFA-related protein
LRLRGFLLFPSIVLSCSWPTVSAQAGAPGAQEQPPVYKANARAVMVDVVVTKGNDEPVLALHKQDFQIMEDGKPQTIDFFEAHSARTLPPGALPSLPKMPPNVYTNVPVVPPSDSVNVLLLDSLNTPKQDQSYVHHQILEFLKGMQPGVRVAIFTLGSKLRFVQGFTSDTSTLVAALNDKKTGVTPEKDPASRSREDNQADSDLIATKVMMMNGHMTGGVESVAATLRDFADFQYGDRAAMTLEALDYLARYLGGVPGRKNLLWFSSSFPVTIFPSPAQRQAASEMRIYASTVKKTADLLTVSKVAVYPIGAEGMMAEHILEANEAGPTDTETAGSTNVGGGRAANVMAPYIAGNAARSDKIAAMEQLAKDTGGKAFYNTNDLNGAMNHAINDGAHYYTLAYTPTNKKLDGGYRRIEIKLTQGRYKLAYRRGYNADDAAKTAETRPEPDPLRPLLVRGLPGATQLLYGVRVAPVSPQPAPDATRAGKNPALTCPCTRYGIDFMIRWTDVDLQPTPQGSRTGKIQVGLLAYDRAGNAVNWVGATQGMNLKPEVYAAIQKSGIPAHMEIDLPNTDVYLETGIYDWGTNKAGTLEIPLPPTSAMASTTEKATAKTN